MDYSGITIFSLMKTKLAYHAERQDLLSRNVANADTPGYIPKDLPKLDFARLAMMEASRLELRATNPGHFPQGATAKAGLFKEKKFKKTYEMTPVKNRVALEEQMAKVSQNQIDYQMTTNLYKKTTDLFRIAVANR